jgi:hypothetical protein
MSVPKSNLNSLSKTALDGLKKIQPVLQSRKKPETKKVETPAVTLKERKNFYQVKKPENPKKTSGANSEINLIGYKLQRELRQRNQVQAKTERRSFKEVEKIQKIMRKSSLSQISNKGLDIKSENDKKNKTPSSRVRFNEYIIQYEDTESNPSQIFNKTQDIFFEKPPIEINQEVNFFDKYNYGYKVQNYLNNFEIQEENFSEENSSVYMPEIPLFQCNYEPISEFQDFDTKNDVLETYERIPYPGTVCLIHEIDLSVSRSRSITIIASKYEVLELPILENRCFVTEAKTPVKKIMVFNQEDWNPPMITRVINTKTFEIVPKPIIPLIYEENPIPEIELLITNIDDYEVLIKPVTNILTQYKYALFYKPISWISVQRSCFSVTSKPQVNFYYKECNQVEYNRLEVSLQTSPELQRIFTDSCNSPIAKHENFCHDSPFFNDSQNFIDSSLLNTGPQRFCDDKSYEISTPIFQIPENLPRSARDPEKSIRSYIRTLISLKTLKEKRLKLAKLKRMKESAVYIISKISKTSFFNCYFNIWKSSMSLLDNKLILKFLSYSATFIQKNWRGYYTRKYAVPQTYAMKLLVSKLKALLVGWKTRKILKTRRIQNHLKNIKDLKKMIYDLNRGVDASTQDLLNRMVGQLPNMHSKFIKDFNTLYRTGTWSALYAKRPNNSTETQKNTPNEPQFMPEPEIIKKKYHNRDEIPIKPMAATYDEILEEFPVQIEDKPKKVFTNFLKRKSYKNNEKSVNAQEAVKEKVEITESVLEKIDENEEETMHDEKNQENKPKEFLKRKSQSIKPKKVQWKVEKKIDCWVSKDIYMKKPPKRISEKEKNYLSIEELEEIFDNVIQNYTDTSTYLKKFERIACKTKIPQFKTCCEFLLVYREDTYYQMLEKMESRYLQLCSQGLKL